MERQRTFRVEVGRRLSVEHLEDRRMLVAGVTVITHGAQFAAFGDPGLPDWTVTMGQAILDRADGALTGRNQGSLFQNDQATGLWRAVGDAAWINSNTVDDQIVLLYEWADESAVLENGWLEAAADHLYSSLLSLNQNLAGAIQGKSFFEAAVDAGSGGGLLDLHFIGHSRGGVLNSRVAERFARDFPELMIDQVTTLDAHPASYMNDPGYVATNPSANSRVFTYTNVAFADNYYQSDGSYEPLFTFDFDGVIANGAYNLQLPTPVLENGGAGLEHSDVHTWYYGTITEPFAAGYSGFSGAGRNHDGDTTFPEAWWGASGVPARTATGFAFSEIGGASRAGLPTTGVKSPVGVVETVVNGGIVHADGDSIPGWELHGGGGTGETGGSDLYLQLKSGGEDYFRRHNPLYFPRHTTAVEFDYWVNDADGGTLDDVLQVIAGGTVIDTVSLALAGSDFTRDRRATFALPSAGATATLEFRILDGLGDGIESAVRIDNVSLVVQPPAPRADFDVDGDVDGADFLTWQRGLGTYVTATRAAGDADLDGNVLADDLAAWRGGFGTAASSTPADTMTFSGSANQDDDWAPSVAAAFALALDSERSDSGGTPKVFRRAWSGGVDIGIKTTGPRPAADLRAWRPARASGVDRAIEIPGPRPAGDLRACHPADFAALDEFFALL
jgi:hypothetical protein